MYEGFNLRHPSEIHIISSNNYSAFFWKQHLLTYLHSFIPKFRLPLCMTFLFIYIYINSDLSDIKHKIKKNN